MKIRGPLCLLAASAVVGSALTACAGSPPRASSTVQGMWLHFDAANRVQMAMVRGDLTSAREAARRVEATRTLSGIPEGSEARLEELRSYAHAIRTAPSYAMATEATARMAAGCGTCHAETMAGPSFTGRLDPPGEVAGEVGHMVEHVWAADRMWEGLMLPSDERWEAGAVLLGDHPVPAESFTPEMARIGERLVALSREAASTEGAVARARVYGRILEACGTCHAEAGIH